MRSANCDCGATERERERERAACIFNLLVSGKYTVRESLTQQACQMGKFASLPPISLLFI